MVSIILETLHFLLLISWCRYSVLMSCLKLCECQVSSEHEWEPWTLLQEGCVSFICVSLIQ